MFLDIFSVSGFFNKSFYSVFLNNISTSASLQLCAVCFQLMPYLITLILTPKHLHMTGVNVSRVDVHGPHHLESEFWTTLCFPLCRNS